ncbi:MAG: hypothetical protein CMN73_09055, partial [Sphingomonas sp.]|nr:hypothetical protein [Sphingomonas sp.]
MLKLNCLEPLTAIGIGVGACALAPLDAGLTAGAVIGGAGLFARIRLNSRKAGLDDAALVKRMQREIFRATERWDDSTATRDARTLADQAMTTLLPEVMFTREELAAIATETADRGERYPVIAARKIVDRLGELNATFAESDPPTLARQFALDVVEAALIAAKQDPDYARLLTLDITIEIARAQAENNAMLRRVIAEQQEHHAVSRDNNAMLLQLVDRLGPEERRGLTEEALIALARRVTEDVSDVDEARAAVERAIEAFVETREQAARGTNLGDLVDAALRRIAARNAEADFEGGAAEGERAWAALAEQEATLQAGKAAIVDINIRQSRMRGDPDALARWISERIRVEQGELAFAALTAEIKRYREDGLRRGLRFETRTAIALSRLALAIAATSEMRGESQNSLGICTSDLGERTGGPEGLRLLDEAVATYRDALTVRTRDDMPAQWAITQNNLANALQTQGERTGGPEGLRLLDEAVAAYRDVITVCTRNNMPAQWAITQNNLANALRKQGERTGGPEGLRLLDEAVAAYRGALIVHSRDDMPAQWAITQNNLATALSIQGERTGGPEGLRLLDEAVAAYRDALTVYSRDMPADWAMTQNNLANALSTQGERTGGPEGLRLLDEAVAAYRDALTVRTSHDMPADWAATQNNLAIALQTRGSRTGGPEGLRLLDEAVAAYRNALTVRTRDDMPADWAMTQNNVAIALQALGARTGGPEGLRLLDEAVAAYRNALTVRTRD